MLATGKIKKYQIVVGSIGFLSFPLTYVFFKLGYPPDSLYWALYIFMGVACLAARLILLQRMVPGFNASVFLKKVILPLIITLFPIIVISYYIHSRIALITIWSFIGESMFVEGLSLVFIWFFALSREERKLAKIIIQKQINRIFER